MKLKSTNKTIGSRVRKKFAFFPVDLGDFRAIGWPEITGRIWLEWYWEEQWWREGVLWGCWQTMIKWQGDKPKDH